MPSPVRRGRLHRALGSESVYAGVETFNGYLDAVSVWSVALAPAVIAAGIHDTSTAWTDAAPGVCCAFALRSRMVLCVFFRACH